MCVCPSVYGNFSVRVSLCEPSVLRLCSSVCSCLCGGGVFIFARLWVTACGTSVCSHVYVGLGVLVYVWDARVCVMCARVRVSAGVADEEGALRRGPAAPFPAPFLPGGDPVAGRREGAL